MISLARETGETAADLGSEARDFRFGCERLGSDSKSLATPLRQLGYSEGLRGKSSTAEAIAGTSRRSLQRGLSIWHPA